MSPAKHGRNIGIMTPSAASSSSALSLCWFPIDYFEGMHQFHSNFSEGSSIIKYRSSSKKGVIRKILTELWPLILCSHTHNHPLDPGGCG